MGFVVAYDTVCQGWQCTKDENEKPVVFATALDAWKEILDSAIAVAHSRKDEEPDEEFIASDEQVKEMQRLMQVGTVEEIISFFDNNSECNDYEEFVVKEEDYIEGRKSIFGVEH